MWDLAGQNLWKKIFCFHNCSLKLHETKTIFAFCLVFMAKSQSLGHIYLVVKHRQNPWTCTNIHFQWSSSSSKPGSPEVILFIMGKLEMAKKNPFAWEKTFICNMFVYLLVIVQMSKTFRIKCKKKSHLQLDSFFHFNFSQSRKIPLRLGCHTHNRISCSRKIE